MPRLMIVIGSNGAGKTTWCVGNRDRLPPHFYDADSIARGLGDWNDAGRQQEARRLVDAAIQDHLENNDDFGFESTYSGRSRPGIVENAAARGYQVHAVFIGTTRPEINLRRVQKRVAAGIGHSVPQPKSGGAGPLRKRTWSQPRCPWPRSSWSTTAAGSVRSG